MQTNSHKANSPRTLGADGDPLQPGSFEFLSIRVLRKDVFEDITDIVTRVDLVQDIDSPVTLANIVVRDNRGFIENSSVKLLGHEMILIRLREKPHSEENVQPRELTLRFVIREYKDFEVDSSGIYTKQFSIDAISNYAYLSRINKISQSVKGDPILQIADIFDKHMLYDKNKYFDYSTQNICASPFSGVITYRTPLQAIKWLKSKAFDSEKSPFFIFSRLKDGAIVARSWGFLANKKTNRPYKKYIQRKSSNFEPGSYESYAFEKNKIVEIVADNKNNELAKTLAGKYTLRTKTVDYSDLTYNESDSSAIELLSPDERKTYDRSLTARNELLETVGIDDSDLVSFAQNRVNPSEIIFQKPYPLYSDGTKSSRDIDYDHLQTARYYNAKMNFENYEIVVYGDFNLTPGMMIELDIPKTDSLDQKSALSGAYVISLVIHSFANGKYVNRLGLIKI